MQVKVQSHADGSKFRHVVILPGIAPQEPPKCCVYSTNRTGSPCFHGSAVLGEKYGYANMHKFVTKRHLTAAWKELYDNFSFPIPSQSDVDALRIQAKISVIKGTNVKFPKSLPPQRGLPVKKTGKSKQRPAANKTRSYFCSLCRSDTHTVAQCQLKQLFK